jgi:hypothetical protein
MDAAFVAAAVHDTAKDILGGNLSTRKRCALPLLRDCVRQQHLFVRCGRRDCGLFPVEPFA